MDGTHIDWTMVSLIGALILFLIRGQFRRRLADTLRRAADWLDPWVQTSDAAADHAPTTPASAGDGSSLEREYIVTVGGVRMLAYSAWSQMLNDKPDRRPHTLIVGPTGSGKTTFTRAMLATRTGRVVVLTPKPDPFDWPGVPIITIDDDGTFGMLSQAFTAIHEELRARLVAAKYGRPLADTLTIVCDDWPVLARECTAASDVFKLVGRLGRSLRVRIVVLSQSARVKSLGLDGEGDTVANFARVMLGVDHTATLEQGGRTLPLDTRLVPTLANQSIAPQRWWEPVPVVSAGVILADLLVPVEPVPIPHDLVPRGSRAAEPVPEAVAGREPVPDPDATKIHDLIRQGWSRNQIAGELGGRKSEALARIKRALGA
jgi:hypothetical protein